MVNIHEVLRMKENEIAKVREEIAALRTVAPLLSDEDESEVLEAEDEPGGSVDVENVVRQEDVVAEQDSEREVSQVPGPIFSAAIPPKRSRLRNWLGRAAGE